MRSGILGAACVALGLAWFSSKTLADAGIDQHRHGCVINVGCPGIVVGSCGDVVDDDDLGLPEAMLGRDLRAAELLLERGADATWVDGAGWTLLHYLSAGFGAEQDELLLAKLARRLVKAGVEVDAVTDVVAWTPLHLAAGGGNALLVDALLALGADPNAATRIGGWTPLDVALKRDVGAGVVDALRSVAGQQGKAKGGAGLAHQVHGGASGEWGQHEFYFPDGAGGCGVRGLFTQAVNRERLAFDPLGVGGARSSHNYLQAAGLVAAAGAVRLVSLFDHRGRSHLLGFCRDSVTGLDHMLTELRSDASARGNELQIWHFDESAGTLITAYSFELFGNDFQDGDSLYAQSSAWPGIDGQCRWRNRQAASHRWAKALENLQVGKLPTFDGSGSLDFPSRDIDGEMAERLLAFILAMPRDVATIENALDVLVPRVADPQGDGDYERRRIKSDRWEVVKVWGAGRGPGGYLRSDEAMLVHDKLVGAWRSMHDCVDVEVQGLEGSELMARFRDGSGGCGEPGEWFDLILNLETMIARPMATMTP